MGSGTNLVPGNINPISNARFGGDLSGWDVTGSAAYAASVGNGEPGSCLFSGAGASISQDFGAASTQEYMIELSGFASAGSGTIDIDILDSGNNIIKQLSLAVDNSEWADLDTRVGLYSGNFTIKISYNDVSCYIDDISVACVLKTRLELANEAAELLGELATADAGFVTTPNGDDTEGDYTEAVSAGLRAISAINWASQPDVRLVTADNVDACVDEIQQYMLHKLHRYYARNATDYTLGERSEKVSQRRAAIENLLGVAVGGRASASGRAVQQRSLIHNKGI